MTVTYSLDDPEQAARLDLDHARGHADTAVCYMSDAVGHLVEGARRTRAQEILDRATALLADVDRLRASLTTEEAGN